jgi:hypothetical protein
MTDKPIDLAHLRALATRATPGNWAWWTSNSHNRLVASIHGHDTQIISAYVAGDRMPCVECRDVDRAFTEAFQPSSVIALLDRLEAAESSKANPHILSPENQN